MRRVLIKGTSGLLMFLLLFNINALAATSELDTRSSNAYGFSILCDSGFVNSNTMACTKSDYEDADVFPNDSKCSNTFNGIVYFINVNSATHSADNLASGVTTRFDTDSFNISYKPTYACPGERFLTGMPFAGHLYRTYVEGVWYP